jgi:hypothetical protein
MNVTRRDKRVRRRAASISIIVPVAICAFAITLTSVAQVADPVPASSMAAVKVSAPKVQFKAPQIPALKAGVPSAFNLCNNQVVPIGKGKFTDAVGQKMDTGLTPCGEQSTTTPNTVAGGNPPYSFQLDSGSFPPLGMHLGLNGLLYGTPAPPTLGGYKSFRVCAVDLSANADCHEVTINPQPPQVKAHSHVPLVLGAVAAGGAAAVVVGARTTSSSSSSSGVQTGTCDGNSPVNRCTACSCTEPGTCNNPSNTCGGSVCYWAGPGSVVGNAPFCP